MSIDQWIKILEVLVSFLQAILWPLLALFALLFLGKTLKNYLNDLRKDKNVSELNAEVGATGFKFNVKRQVEVASTIATNLALAVKESKTTESPGNEQISNEDQVQEVINVASKAAIQTSHQVVGAKVLWVDDNPSNNRYERRALEVLGIQFTISLSTEDALEKVRYNRYDAIISDMGRPPDRQAGYTLLEELRKRNINIPFIIYAGSNSPEHKAEIVRRGGFGTTNNPQELVELVIHAINTTKRDRATLDYTEEQYPIQW